MLATRLARTLACLQAGGSTPHPDRFCRSEENKKWFLRNEERLFAYRLQRFTKLAEPATVCRAGFPPARVTRKQWKIIHFIPFSKMEITNFHRKVMPISYAN